MWDEIISPFPTFNGATVEVWEWIYNFIPHFFMDVISYPYLGLRTVYQSSSWLSLRVVVRPIGPRNWRWINAKIDGSVMLGGHANMASGQPLNEHVYSGKYIMSHVHKPWTPVKRLLWNTSKGSFSDMYTVEFCRGTFCMVSVIISVTSNGH